MSRAQTTSEPIRFDPAAFSTFRFTGRSISGDGNVSLRYALDDVHAFEERISVPLASASDVSAEAVEGLLDLLHWVAGVSYYKAAAPSAVACETGAPPPATAALLESLYSEGLGEFAVVNELAALPAPSFPRVGTARDACPAAGEIERVLVPVGGGKDSAVAIEIARHAGLQTTLFSIGDPPPIAGTVRVSGLPRLLSRRSIDAQLLACNAAGALNGHVPVTAIVSAVALLAAAVNDAHAVALANERSASSPNTIWRGTPINHQFSKSARAERLLAAAVAEVPGAPRVFSLLRPASELAIARAFARMTPYHDVFTSCNRVFRLDPAARTHSWCCDCDKCRFVFLILAPYLGPAELTAIFGADLLADDRQYEGFATLTATGSHKPFECVGEEIESAVAIALIAGDGPWCDHAVVRRLAADALPRFNAADVDPRPLLALSDDHAVPDELIGSVRALLGA